MERETGAMKLGQIIGQPAAVAILRAALPPGAPAHAYLFVGPEGVGKTTAAMAWARALLCERGGEDACGACAHCVKTAAGTHPDMMTLEPEAREKKVKEEIDIGHIRDVIRRLSFKPYEAGRKILIVDRADSMNLSAANAFLKTLEEPPGDTVIIMTAVNTRKLPLTIISRCRVVRFNPVPFGEIVDFLVNREGMAEDEARSAAALSRGSLGLAVSGEIEGEREIRAEALQALVDADSRSPARIYGLAGAMDKAKDKSRTDRFLEMMMELARDLLAVKIQGKYDNLINVDIAPEIERAASKFSQRRLIRACEIIQEMIAARRWNINPLLIVSLLSLELKE